MTTALDISRPITAEDRCDKCSARAVVRATLVNGELCFCGHHARDLGYTLVQKAIKVYDPEGVFDYANR